MAKDTGKKIDIELFKAITDGLFRKILSFIMIVFGGRFLFNVAANDSGELRTMIITAVLTTLSLIVGFYFGTSQSSQDKENKNGGVK